MLHQQFVDRSPDAGDLLVAVRRCAQFQPIQRALARQRLVQVALARQNPQQRIVPQLLMIVQILVAQRQAVDPLRHHLRHRVLAPAQALRPSRKHSASRGSRFSRRSVSRSSSATAIGWSSPRHQMTPPRLPRKMHLQIRNWIGYTLS